MRRRETIRESPLPACKEKSDREAIRVRGVSASLSFWNRPLTPTLSPQAGRGSSAVLA